MNRKISQCIITASLSSSITHIDHRSRKDGGVYHHWLSVNYHSPVLESLLTEEIMREILNSLELLLRILSAGSKDISHLARIFSDGLWYSIDSAKFWRNMTVLSVDFDDEERLLKVSHLQVVVLGEVLCNTKLLAIMSLESHCHWSFVEVNILDEVGLFMTVSADHSLKLELMENLRLLITDVRRIHDLVNSLKASLVRDELVDVVDHNRET